MFVGISILEVHLPEVRSLKEKRKEVKSLVDRIHKRYRVSVAETDFHDLHQRSEISIAAVGNGEAEIRRLLDGVQRLVESQPTLIVTRWDPQILEGTS